MMLDPVFCVVIYKHPIQICSRNLDRVRKLKSAMTRLIARVQKVHISPPFIHALDNHRNQLIQVIVSFDIFGLTNIFLIIKQVVGVGGLLSVLILVVILVYARYKGLIGA
ncbi:hypothetical protein BHE74_00026183 [Ensete ventricosum]|nr:hypothetical protein BHE74_00026183 [Ensete ventricosum]